MTKAEAGRMGGLSNGAGREKVRLIQMDRKRRVKALSAQGLKQTEIAARLGISQTTVSVDLRAE